MASGINPSIVVMAVNSTGRNLAFPAFTFSYELIALHNLIIQHHYLLQFLQEQ